MIGDRPIPLIQVCSLEAAKEADVIAYDGVITIEDSRITDPFRCDGSYPPQLVLRFDDIVEPVDDWVMPKETHIRSALKFVHQWELPSLLIHCHAGMSRSPAIALAIIAEWFGDNREDEAVRELLSIARLCTPNRLVVEIADSVLGREGRLVQACKRAL